MTVIATGFQPHCAPVAEVPRNIAPIFVPQPELVPELVAVASIPDPEPQPVMEMEPEPAFDLDDLDTPAYLRQGRLLN